jgi:hypothetical protein
MHMVRCSRPGGVSALLTTQMLRIRVLGRSAFQFSLPPSSRMRTHVPQKYSVSRGSRKIDMYKFSAGSSCMQFEAHDTPDRVGTKKLCIWTRNSISLSFAHVVYQLRCFFSHRIFATMAATQTITLHGRWILDWKAVLLCVIASWILNGSAKRFLEPMDYETCAAKTGLSIHLHGMNRG